MRHTILVEQGAGAAWEMLRDAPDQHFLGDDLLIAPVLEAGASSRDVVLPAGRWYPLLTGGGAVDAGAEPTSIQVAAPLGTIPVFARAGSILPLGAKGRQTAYPAAPDDGVLDLIVFTGADTSMTLDGRTWSLTSTPEASGDAPSLNGSPLPDCADAEAVGCVVSNSGETGLGMRIEWGSAPAVLSGDGWELSTDNGGGLSSTVVVRYGSAR
jgi:hypothetical protein